MILQDRTYSCRSWKEDSRQEFQDTSRWAAFARFKLYVSVRRKMRITEMNSRRLQFILSQ